MPEEVRRLAGLLERRFSIAVIWASHEGATRFNEFVQALRPVAPGTLTARLNELEEAGVLRRVVVDGRPPRTEYRLTPEGERLAAIVAALGALTRR
ncbi:MAG TPA: helix-turn-helix domain-containing protein [Gaiellaceae bacterium]|jgi:DNA-binding HxlR family transcriptional regulator|nr:helix-turn-helix domain-containing protein [Gaiellaceae bacterium]